jgi:hypothetical protein
VDIVNGPWVPQLAASLRAVRDVANAAGTHVTTTYQVRPGCRDQAVQAIADLVVFLCSGAEDASDPSSWRTGRSIARVTWARLTREEPPGRCTEMKALIGEAIAWWHETQCAEVVFAERPHAGTSQPFVDSISILQCGDAQVIRGVQAKATALAPRPRVHEALGKFERLQRGERDEFWAEAVRRLRRGVRGVPGIAVDFAKISTGTQLRHVQTFVCHGLPPPTDPAHDYGTRVTAHAPHGRSLGLLHEPEMERLVCEVAAAVRRSVLT